MTTFSVITPTASINPHILNDLIPALKNQSYKDFELLLITEQSTSARLPSFTKVTKVKPNTRPATKRDLAVKQAKGKYLAFIDDDAYPDPNWLKNSLQLLKKDRISAVCGPGLTPPANDTFQQVSGYIWSTWLGAGSNTFRASKSTKKYIDDYPSFNLIVKKKDFNQIGGFNTKFWPGEDTVLCHNLVYKLRKSILYSPIVIVYHHRRRIMIPHLKQIARYGLHRGHFVKKFPKTSLRFNYFLPPLFLLWIITAPFFFPAFPPILLLYAFSLTIYALLILTQSAIIALTTKNLLLALLYPPSIILTHLFYGVYFLKGLLKPNLLK